jgi:hypothetical protein
MFNSKSNSNENWPHTSLFHSTCTIKNKVYTLIINSGIYENMVLVEAIKKQLKKKTLQAYKWKWLNQDSMIIVDQHCLVLFSTSKRCFDNAWCDMVSMDACHLLLGRPWQYDGSVVHDGP